MRKPEERELSLYEKLFEPEAPIDIKKGLNDGELVCAPAVSGDKYEQSQFRLMYIGRALGGWDCVKGTDAKSLTRAIFDVGYLDNILEDVVHAPQRRDGEKNLLYSFRKSSFWQLCHSVMSKVGEEEDWAKRIVWSNVYKVSPQGNDNGSWDLLEETFLPCVDILRYELELFKPTHVVFVTGAAYFLAKDFQKSFKSADSEPIMRDPKGIFEVISRGIYECEPGKKIKMVVTTRPEFRAGSVEEKAEKIIRAFQSLD